jgi:hypothetical protein
VALRSRDLEVRTRVQRQQPRRRTPTIRPRNADQFPDVRSTETKEKTRPLAWPFQGRYYDHVVEPALELLGADRCQVVRTDLGGLNEQEGNATVFEPRAAMYVYDAEVNGATRLLTPSTEPHRHRWRLEGRRLMTTPTLIGLTSRSGPLPKATVDISEAVCPNSRNGFTTR